MEDLGAGLEQTKCRWCPAMVMWVASTKGRPMPLDPMPTVDGNVIIERNGTGVRARVLTKAELAQGQLGLRPPRRKAHFATCTGNPDPRRRR